MIILLLVFLASCATSVTPPAEVKIPTMLSLFPKQEWTDHAYKEIEASGIAKISLSDSKSFCPNRLTSKNWVHLMAAMSKRESNFKPETSYREAFKHNGEYVVSRGLLQISIDSGNAYGCGFKTVADVHDPLQNLSCGVKILKRWAERDGHLSKNSGGKWTGSCARYWSVCRHSLPKTLAVLKPNCQ